jgi:hypothetical protein
VEPDPEALRRIQDSLRAEDYELRVTAADDIARVTIAAGPAACADCLVSKDLMRAMLAPALGLPPDRIELTYPAEAQ